MAQGDWEPDESDQEWLPDFDVRPVVAQLPSGPVTFDDFSWGPTLDDDSRIPEIREAIEGLHADDATADKAITALNWLICSDGHTSVFAVGAVPELISVAEDQGSHVRVKALQLAGDAARVGTALRGSRSELLQTMWPAPMYDSWGYLENWAVEAVRMMLGREAHRLIRLLGDEDPQVRGRAAYVVTTALPASQAITDALKARLAVETDAAAQMILVVSIAQQERERDLAAEATAWAQTLWSDPGSPTGVRLGGAIAWLALSPAPVPPQLQTLLHEMPMPGTDELLRQLPWVWWLTFQAGAVESWWQDLP